MPISKLKADILERYASIHAFCKAHKELARASVYLLLSGRYPGNTANQTARVKAALSGQIDPKPERGTPLVSVDAMSDTLQSVRCDNCRRLNRRECMACRDQTAREAAELYERLYGNEPEKEGLE